MQKEIEAKGNLTTTYFTKGWHWDNSATFTQFYNGKACAKFIVRMKDGYRFQDYIL